MGKNIIIIVLIFALGVSIALNYKEKQTQCLLQHPATDSSASKQQLLEQRIATLESQWKDFQNMVQQAKAVRQGPPQEDFTKVYDIPVGQSYVKGKVDAPVTIVAFVDFQCPFCSRFNSPVVEAINAYSDKVKFMIKNFPLPFHPLAKPAAKAVLAAGEQGKYFEMAHAILKDNSNLSEDRIKQLAQDIGLNVDKFLKDWKDKDAQWEQLIQKDLELVNEINVQGTPTFFINGRKTMARDTAGWKTEIEQILNDKK